MLPEIQFIHEVDKLKSVLRQSSLYDGSRRENSAEHSWQLALAVMTFHNLANQPVDLTRAMQMALVHDVVEIDAGDVFVYDTKGNQNKFANEQKAAERIFGMLPTQAGHLKELWLAYEKQECPESQFVGALDRFLPVFSAYNTQGGAWKRHGVPKERVLALNQKIAKGSTKLWEVARVMIEESFATFT